MRPDRVGILGFSWGGVVSLLSSAGRFAAKYGEGAPPFAAHVAHYPVCWAFLQNPAFALEDLTGAPILLQTGDADTYDTPGAGERLAERLRARGEAQIEAVTYAEAGHGFDRDLPAQTINDPFAHEGAGGPVLMAFDKAAAEAARTRLVTFFQSALG